MSRDISFLERLLDAPGPSGFEARAARVWRSEADSFAEAWADVVGNSYAAVRPDARPLVLLAGHIDEIGLQVTHADKSGLLYFAGIGGWDPQVLVGQRVRVLGAKGDVAGVVGRKAIHLIEPKEREKAAKVKKLWIDVGAGSREEVEDLGVRVGDPAVLDAGMVRLAGTVWRAGRSTTAREPSSCSRRSDWWPRGRGGRGWWRSRPRRRR